jgi:hypothetical protein
MLLDENVPRKLKYRFGADVTFDRGLEYQQDLSGLTIRIVILRAVANRYEDLLPLVPAIESALTKLQPGRIAHVAG